MNNKRKHCGTLDSRHDERIVFIKEHPEYSIIGGRRFKGNSSNELTTCCFNFRFGLSDHLIVWGISNILNQVEVFFCNTLNLVLIDAVIFSFDITQTFLLPFLEWGRNLLSSIILFIFWDLKPIILEFSQCLFEFFFLAEIVPSYNPGFTEFCFFHSKNLVRNKHIKPNIFRFQNPTIFGSSFTLLIKFFVWVNIFFFLFMTIFFFLLVDGFFLFWPDTVCELTSNVSFTSSTFSLFIILVEFFESVCLTMNEHF